MNIDFGVPISPKRPSKVFGEETWADLAVIADAVVVAPQLFVPRGSDLKNDDRFDYEGFTYWVVGQKKWDLDHPMSGDDLGYVEYVIANERGGAP